MSHNYDFEIIKYLLGVVGSLIALFNGISLKMLYGLKVTDEKIFERINKTDQRVMKNTVEIDNLKDRFNHHESKNH